MTLETSENKPAGSIGGYLPQRYIHDTFIITVLSICLERSITLLFWEYESNAIVLALGKETWLAVTAVCIGILWGMWYYLEMYRYRYAVLGYALISLIHLLAAVSNLAVVVF